MKTFDVIIIGGGAAGLMCALTCGKRGKRVLVTEKANKIGKKILMSGGGRCNFTNLNSSPEYFLSDNPKFCISALKQFTQWDFIEMVNQHRIEWHEKKHGQLFCNDTSRRILNMLLKECENADVKIITECDTQQVDINNGFELTTNRGDFKGSSLVVASGGLSIPKMGGSGYGYELARSFGHEIIQTRPALVPFTITGNLHTLVNDLSGLSLVVRASCGKQTFLEDMLFTHRGLSGPAILQISSYWREGNIVDINLLPDINLREVLREQKQKKPRILLRSWLAEMLPKNLVHKLEQLWWLELAETPLAEWPDKKLLDVAAKIRDWQIKPAGTEGYRTAEVTAGGVDTRQLSSQTMESRIIPDLYFIREVLDVTGHLGGHNFQWAWSSAFVAGQFA